MLVIWINKSCAKERNIILRKFSSLIELEVNILTTSDVSEENSVLIMTFPCLSVPKEIEVLPETYKGLPYCRRPAYRRPWTRAAAEQTRSWRPSWCTRTQRGSGRWRGPRRPRSWRTPGTRHPIGYSPGSPGAAPRMGCGCRTLWPRTKLNGPPPLTRPARSARWHLETSKYSMSCFLYGS